MEREITIQDHIACALEQGKISVQQFVRLNAYPTEEALAEAIRIYQLLDKPEVYDENGNHPDLSLENNWHNLTTYHMENNNNFPAAHIAAMKQFLDIDNRSFYLNESNGLYSVYILDEFDTKEEAEYFISLLKAFCK